MEYTTILISRDKELLRAMDSSFFKRSGFLTLVANDGEEAIQVVREQNPVMVVLNLNLRDQGGDICCFQIKQDPVLGSTPVALVARKEVREDILRCQEAGCDAMLFTPVDRRQMVETVSLLLNIVRRKEPRAASHFQARIRTEGGRPYAGIIRNLTSGGAFLETGKLLPPGTILQVEFSLPDPQRQFVLNAKVAWLNHPHWNPSSQLQAGMGIQFVDLPEKIREEILAWNSQAPLPEAEE